MIYCHASSIILESCLIKANWHRQANRPSVILDFESRRFLIRQRNQIIVHCLLLIEVPAYFLTRTPSEVIIDFEWRASSIVKDITTAYIHTCDCFLKCAQDGAINIRLTGIRSDIELRITAKRPILGDCRDPFYRIYAFSLKEFVGLASRRKRREGHSGKKKKE